MRQFPLQNANPRLYKTLITQLNFHWCHSRETKYRERHSIVAFTRKNSQHPHMPSQLHGGLSHLSHAKGDDRADGTGSPAYGEGGHSEETRTSESNIPNEVERDRTASIRIIDGTRNVKNGVQFWVQRHVVTVRIQCSFRFDECLVTCSKQGMSEQRYTQTLYFAEHFTKIAENRHHDDHDSSGTHLMMRFEAVFKTKLLYTSGRPENQRKVWLTASFFSGNTTIASATTDEFLVCSRPGNEMAESLPLSDTSETPASTKQDIDIYKSAKIVKWMNRRLHGTPAASRNDVEQKRRTGSRSATSAAAEVPATIPRNSIETAHYSGALGASQVQPVITNYPLRTLTTQYPDIHSYGQLHPFRAIPVIPPTTSTTTSVHLARLDMGQNVSPSTPVGQFEQQSAYSSPFVATPQHLAIESVSQFSIDSIEPNRGDIKGGERITLTGTFPFSQPIQLNSLVILFGLLPAPRIEHADHSRIVCISPQRLIEGKVQVTVSLMGESFASSIFFTYKKRQHREEEIVR